MHHNLSAASALNHGTFTAGQSEPAQKPHFTRLFQLPRYCLLCLGLRLLGGILLALGVAALGELLGKAVG